MSRSMSWENRSGGVSHLFIDVIDGLRIRKPTLGQTRNFRPDINPLTEHPIPLTEQIKLFELPIVLYKITTIAMGLLHRPNPHYAVHAYVREWKDLLAHQYMIGLEQK